MRAPRSASERRTRSFHVFLNVPFDAGYQPLFLALLAGVVGFGGVPHCAVEVEETGEGRLARILGLLQECDTSIHDLSRVGVPARFNMPFELGLACAVRHLRPRSGHRFFLLEAKAGHLNRRLSDLRHVDPYLHRDSARGVIAAVSDMFGGGDYELAFHAMRRLHRGLKLMAAELIRERRSGTVFRRAIFQQLVAAATLEADALRLIQT